ncbi:hypothetical protein HYQ46_002315 [Verticillium longisporum]|nr:hypothetical protein HYQ46_002315 [Verticillium longisporum]
MTFFPCPTCPSDLSPSFFHRRHLFQLLNLPDTWFYSAHFEQSGKGRLATAGGDNNVRIWKVEGNGSQRRTMVTQGGYARIRG